MLKALAGEERHSLCPFKQVGFQAVVTREATEDKPTMGQRVAGLSPQHRATRGPGPEACQLRNNALQQPLADFRPQRERWGGTSLSAFVWCLRIGRGA